VLKIAVAGRASIAAMTTAASVLQALERRGATLATAESITGGRVAAALTAVPGSSDSFVGGIVAYAAAVKEGALRVPPTLIARHGVVSAECARSMAEGARALTGATWAVSTTGVAGPGEQDGVAAGTVYVGAAGPGGPTAVALELSGDRAAVQEQATREALSALHAILDEEETRLG
jgi:nicotinamide-nucleotide amidase